MFVALDEPRPWTMLRFGTAPWRPVVSSAWIRSSARSLNADTDAGTRWRRSSVRRAVTMIAPVALSCPPLSGAAVASGPGAFFTASGGVAAGIETFLFVSCAEAGVVTNAAAATEPRNAARAKVTRICPVAPAPQTTPAAPVAHCLTERSNSSHIAKESVRKQWPGRGDVLSDEAQITPASTGKAPRTARDER